MTSASNNERMESPEDIGQSRKNLSEEEQNIAHIKEKIDQLNQELEQAERRKKKYDERVEVLETLESSFRSYARDSKTLGKSAKFTALLDAIESSSDLDSFMAIMADNFEVLRQNYLEKLKNFLGNESASIFPPKIPNTSSDFNNLFENSCKNCIQNILTKLLELLYHSFLREENDESFTFNPMRNSQSLTSFLIEMETIASEAEPEASNWRSRMSSLQGQSSTDETVYENVLRTIFCDLIACATQASNPSHRIENNRVIDFEEFLQALIVKLTCDPWEHLPQRFLEKFLLFLKECSFLARIYGSKFPIDNAIRFTVNPPSQNYGESLYNLASLYDLAENAPQVDRRKTTEPQVDRRKTTEELTSRAIRSILESDCVDEFLENLAVEFVRIAAFLNGKRREGFKDSDVIIAIKQVYENDS